MMNFVVASGDDRVALCVPLWLAGSRVGWADGRDVVWET